jgi:hypothetical protein
MANPICGVGMLDVIYVAISKDLYFVRLGPDDLVLWVLPTFEIVVDCWVGGFIDPDSLDFCLKDLDARVESTLHLARETI